MRNRPGPRCAAAIIAMMIVVASAFSVGEGAARADGEYQPPTTTVAPPDTSDCGQQTTPPPAVDTSEDLAPGQAAPTPLPVPADPVGGALLAGCDFVLPSGAPELPSDISAQAWLVSDLTTGQVLGGKDPHGRYRPASTLKLLTMLAIWPQLPSWDSTIVGDDSDAAQEGSRVGMGPGGVYTIRDLLNGLVLNSGNDTANALARANGGVEKTLADMNASAARIGAVDTRAVTVSGLDGPGQQTSAYDLALIMRADLQLPGFPELIGTDTAMFPGFGEYPEFGIANENKLLDNYPGALGGKTGFTNDAGNTYVGVAERGGHRLVVTMLGGTQQPRRQWMQAASLLDWGFASTAAGLDPIGRLIDPAADAAAAAAAAEAAWNSSAVQSLAASASSASAAAAAAASTSPASAAGTSADSGATGSSGQSWAFWVLLVAVLLLGALYLLRRRLQQRRDRTDQRPPAEPDEF